MEFLQHLQYFTYQPLIKHLQDQYYLTVVNHGE